MIFFPKNTTKNWIFQKKIRKIEFLSIFAIILECFQVQKRKRKSGVEEVEMEDISQEDAPEDGSAEPKSAKRSKGTKGESRVVPVPKHRYTPLKENWVNIFTPIVKNLGLQIRFNLKKRQVELRNPEDREDTTDLQKVTEIDTKILFWFFRKIWK